MSLCACCCADLCQPAEDRSQPQSAAGGGSGFQCWPRHVKQLVNMQCHSCTKLCRDEGCLPAPLRVLAADLAAPARSAHEPPAGFPPATAHASAQRQTQLLRLQSPMPQDTGRQRVCSRCCWAHLQHRICNHVPDKQGRCEVHACCEGCSQLAHGSSQAERQEGDVECELGDGGHSPIHTQARPCLRLDQEQPGLECVQKGALGLGEVELASCPTLHLPADAQMLCSTPMHGSYLAGTAHAPNSVTGPRMSSPACHTSLLSNSGPEAPCHSPHSTPDVRPLICHHIMSSRSQQKPLPPSTLTGVQGATPPRTLKRTHCTHCGTCLYDAWHTADEAETGPCTLKTLKLLASPCCWEPCSCCTRLWHLSPQKPAPPHP